MNKDLLNGLLGALKDIDSTGELQKEIANLESLADTLLQKNDKLKEKVSSKEYIEWVYSTATPDSIKTENPVGKYTGIEEENRRLLHVFFDYVADLAQEQGVPVTNDGDRMDPSDNIAFKIKDKYFVVTKIYTGYEITLVTLLDELRDEFVVVE